MRFCTDHLQILKFLKPRRNQRKTEEEAPTKAAGVVMVVVVMTGSAGSGTSTEGVTTRLGAATTSTTAVVGIADSTIPGEGGGGQDLPATGETARIRIAGGVRAPTVVLATIRNSTSLGDMVPMFQMCRSSC
jgi:hypothetical protein